MSIAKSAAWDFAGKIINQVIAFIVSVVLARLLTPHEFGIVGISLAFVGLSTIFLDLGFKNAIIQKQEVDKFLYSTVLWINIGVSVILAIIFLFASKSIAVFYKEPEVAGIIKATVLLFVINAATLLPNAINIKALKFKELAIISIISSFISGAIAIWMAYSGWGVWSILARNILNALLTCILNWFICNWLPSLIIRINSLKSIFGYSSRMFATTLMEIIVQRADVLIMGKVYNTATVGYYTRAQSLDNISRELTSGSMYSVFFPFFSKIQNNDDQVKALYLKCLHIISFALLLITGILFLNANDIFVLLFTAKWLPSAGLYKMLTVVGFLYTISVIMNIVLAGIGKSKEFLIGEVIKKLLIVSSFVIGFTGNLQHFLWALLIAYLLGLFVSMVLISKSVSISFKDQLFIILRYCLVAIISILVCNFLLNQKIVNPFLSIMLMSTSYVLLYIGLHYILRSKALNMIYEQVKVYVFKKHVSPKL